MRYLVHLYVTKPDGVAEPALPGYAGEFDTEAEAAAVVRERYPNAFATPPIHDPEGCYIFLFRDHLTITDDALAEHYCAHEMEELIGPPCGRVVAVPDPGPEQLYTGPIFDFNLWLPDDLRARVAASLIAQPAIDAS